MEKYVIGVDFGTLSGRAILVKVADGRSVTEEAMNYPHGVIEGRLPDGTPLPAGFALADVRDYVTVLEHDIKAVMERSGVPKEAVIGIGLDVTSSTFVPTDATGTPLYLLPGFGQNPHAWMKMWKHHGAQKQADRLTRLMVERKEPFLIRSGGKINAEWMMPKLLEICEDAPEVYEKTANFEEACDFLVRHLTGACTRSLGPLGYKLVKDVSEDTPDRAFYRAVNPGFEGIEEKLLGTRVALGKVAGYVTEEIADRLGLPAGIPVAAGNIDAHVAYPALGITEKNRMVLIAGTSCCAVLAADQECMVPGIFGMVKDGVMPGLVGYEAGQSCVGDMFQWFVDECVPARYEKEAAQRGLSVHQLLTEKAEKKAPGETGLLALDWWNGNRSCLSDTDLTGMILGMTLHTKAEDIYRALLESVVYGIREIIETFRGHGVPVEGVYICGGISKKNDMLMQIYADVLNTEIRVGESSQCSALGSAIHGAAAAGEERGGYRDMWEASAHMGRTQEKSFCPIPENVALYEKLYQEYHTLHDYFGKGGNDVMKRLIRK